MSLIRTAQIKQPDEFYETLLKAQSGMTDAQAQKMIAKLVLLLANHVGDEAVLAEAIALAAASSQVGRNDPASCKVDSSN